MTPINSSDTAWLIVSDYNQDNDLPYEELREDILNPDTDQWHWEYIVRGVGSTEYPIAMIIVINMGDHVGSGNAVFRSVGTITTNTSQLLCDNVSLCVGGK